MSRIKAPNEKKAAELKRDHRTWMEAPHAFRKNWSKKKARANRGHRRTLEAQVEGILAGDDPEAFSPAPRKRSISKSGVAPLGKRIATNQRARITFTASSYLLGPYSPEAVEGFKACLGAIMKGRRGASARYAAWLNSLLNEHQVPTSSQWYEQRWLRRLFRAEPELRRALESWLTRTAAGRTTMQ